MLDEHVGQVSQKRPARQRNFPASVGNCVECLAQAAFDIRDAFSREIIIGGLGRLAIRALFAQAQTLDAYMDFEE